MASLYAGLDMTFTNSIDGIDVDRLSMPTSPTHPSRKRNGSVNTVGSQDGGGGGAGAGDAGLGTLADELAALDFDDDDEGDYDYGEEEEEHEQEQGEGGEAETEAEGDGEYAEDEENRQKIEGSIRAGKAESEEEEAGEAKEEAEEEEKAEGQEFVGELPNGVAEDESGLGLHTDSASGTTRRRSSTTTSVRTIDSHAHTKSKASSLASPKPKRRSGSVRWQNPDAVDSGDEIEGLKDGITVELQDRINQIERLALEGKRMKLGKSVFANDSSGGSAGGGAVGFGGETELDGSHSFSIPQILHDGEVVDDVIPRLMDGLQNLQPQTTMETATTSLITAHNNLITAHSSLSTTLRELTTGLLAFNPAPEETIDLLYDLTVPLIHEPLYEIASLRSITAQLITQLAFISDTLHMTRQSSIVANRKLRVVREACAEWKGELEMAERGRKWIEEGDWVGKCSRREAAGVCGEVMEGFERVCLGVEKDMKAMLTV